MTSSPHYIFGFSKKKVIKITIIAILQHTKSSKNNSKGNCDEWIKRPPNLLRTITKFMRGCDDLKSAGLLLRLFFRKIDI